MLLIYGKKTARIKIATDHHEQCKSCGEFDMSIVVLQDYFHIFYIPVCPVGPKNTKAWCRGCGQPFGEPSFEKRYEDQARTPVYFYTIPILFLLVIVAGVFANFSTQNEKAKFVQNPQTGDIYLIRKDQKDTTVYYFLKIKDINRDSVTLYHNDLFYLSYPESLTSTDSFITMDPLIYTKQTLHKMLESGEINSVKR